MSKKNRKILLVIIIILIVSASLIMSQFGDVSAGDGNTTEEVSESSSTFVEKETSEQSAKPVYNESIAFSLAKLLGALLVVVVGIYGFLYLLRRMMGQRFSGNRSSNLIEVLETAYVAQKKSVSIVRFSDRAVLIGVGESGISVLAELNAEETGRMVAGFAAEKPSSGFRSVLRDAKGRLTGLNMGRLKTLRLSRNADRPQTA